MNLRHLEDAELLLLSGIVRECPDCGGERIFVSVAEEGDQAIEARSAFCCTACGAALLIDPTFDHDHLTSRVA